MWRDSSKAATLAKYKVGAGQAVLNRARALMAHAPDYFVNKTTDFPSFQKWHKSEGSDLDVSSIQKPLQDLQCKDFSWYLSFFSYIYRDAGYLPREVFQLTPDEGTHCLSLGRSNWGSADKPDDKLILKPCTTVPGRDASGGTQYWHLSNRNNAGKCCSGLRAWNTDQCMIQQLKSAVCSLNPNQPAQLTDDGHLQVAGHCLLMMGDSIKEVDCSEAATSGWKKWNAFQPQEFLLLSQEMKDTWN
jgi:polypeptide N-acetylgalactosaminyltransferase